MSFEDRAGGDGVGGDGLAATGGAAVPPGAAWSADGDRSPGGAGRTGIVLCHGFTGSPASLRPWGEALAEQGLTVRIPLLPGHGTSWQDLAGTGFDDWLAALVTAVRELREQCDTVVVGGLSMGGTLTLRLAELHPELVDGIVLVNPSVLSRRWDAKLAPLLRLLRPVLLRVLPSLPGIADDIARPGVVEGGYDRMPVAAALSLQAAWKLVRADLGRITVPLLLLHSRVDHVVEPENAAVVLVEVSSTDVREVVLERSFHVATLDHDAPVIEAESLAFCRRLADRVVGGEPR